MAAIDPELAAWRSIRPAYKRGGILLGNGFSINVWPRFKYRTLREAAKQAEIKHKLRPEDDSLFDELGTDSFEQVLGALLVSIRVLKALDPDRPDIVRIIVELQDRYDHIRQSLIDAVHFVHIERALIPTENLIAIWEELRYFKSVYSTNYDLIIYWASRAWAESRRNNGSSRDFLYTYNEYSDTPNTFSLSASKPHRLKTDSRTDIFYIHGALHLYSHFGITVKLVASDVNLLQQFYVYPFEDALRSLSVVDRR